ncbi:WD40 repeat domain-containing protein [Chloropicon primus]|uniref:Cilia- and flagella-associated protein 251 n=1 Tax=Chloropicon primus TaxID=1764295 RepID=A0A5B8MJX5_9CHLO|nr:WD40 repeat domain-containing protein [Chloropicon primus]UPQ99792.1 WD40 repeat domain-containing protein [Chloropicon primus]|eukprot:QDZ20581.1 WD40 repeat domain-containing protein [Chloropicon primus]
MEEDKKQALSLHIVLGFSSQVIGSVSSLQDGERNVMCYLSGHVLVVHDVETGKQNKLLGHKNAIRCLKTSPDKSLVCTADSGFDSLLIVWDSKTLEPVQILESPYESGFECIDVSTNGKHLITTSSPDSMKRQEFAVWELADLAKGPLCTASISNGDKQYSVAFNPDNDKEFITNGKETACFWTWQVSKESASPTNTQKFSQDDLASSIAGSLSYISPSFNSADFKQKVGKFTTSIFMPGTKTALTATSDGDVVVWEDASIIHQTAGDRFASKVLRLHSQPIGVLAWHGSYLVTGAADGFVRFFDDKLRLVAWYEDMNAGGVTSVSFSSKEVEHCAFSPFNCSEFIIGTGLGQVVRLHSTLFDEVSSENRKGECLFRGIPGKVSSMIESVNDSAVIIASDKGSVHKWSAPFTFWKDTGLGDAKIASELSLGDEPPGEEVKAETKAPEQQGLSLIYEGKQNVMCMAWLSKDVLLLGLANGMLKFYSPKTKEETHPSIKISNAQLKKIVYSAEANVIALYDIMSNLCMLKLGAGKYKDRWDYIGKHAAHLKAAIVDICFVDEDNTSKLYSVGKDGMMVLYDLEGSTLRDGIKVKQYTQIGQGVVPSACTLLSGAVDGSVSFPETSNMSDKQKIELRKKKHMIFADDMGKFRVFDNAKGVQKKIVLSPEYGGTISQMCVFSSKSGEAEPGNEEEEANSANETCLAFAGNGKVVGLVKFPLDGDPYKSCAVVAHPLTVDYMCVDQSTGKYVFTSDGYGVVNLWKVNLDALDASDSQDGAKSSKVERYSTLLEEGMGGEEFVDITNFFYYSQLRVQGEDTSHPRSTPGKVPLSEVPYLMKALGYYLSEGDKQIMRSDVLFQQAMREGRDADSTSDVRDEDVYITFEDFFVLYVNYRPSRGLGDDDLNAAFSKLKAISAGGGRGGKPLELDTEKLVESLCSRGEKMTREEIEQCLLALLGEDILENEPPGTSIISLLPKVLNHKTFAEDILGFSPVGESEA